MINAVQSSATSSFYIIDYPLRNKELEREAESNADQAKSTNN